MTYTVHKGESFNRLYGGPTLTAYCLVIMSSSFLPFRVNSFPQSAPNEASRSHPWSTDKLTTLGSCDVLMESPEAVPMRVTRRARSRRVMRVNKQYEAMAGVRCSACCLGTSASTDGRHLLLRRRRRRPKPPASQPSRLSPKQVA